MSSRLRLPRVTATRHQRPSPTPSPVSFSFFALFAFLFIILIVAVFASPLLSGRDRRGEIQHRRRRFSSEKEEKMPLATLDATVANFEQVFEKFKSENSTTDRLKFLLFVADKDPSTNLSWCPDCNRAEPVIYEKLEASEADVALLRAYVGDRPTWRNPGHPWRIDPRFKLKGVPTLIRWEKETIVGRLEDCEAHIRIKIDALLASN